MNEKPIIFNDEAACAVLDGRKTQYREAIKVQPDSQTAHFSNPNENLWFAYTKSKYGQDSEFYCPYGKKGDRLFVKEKWCAFSSSGEQYKCPPRRLPTYAKIYYLAGADIVRSDVKWKHAIYMPRWASRIMLEITDIRVERVKDISEKDSICEGRIPRHDIFHDSIQPDINNPATRGFANLWDSINKKRGFGWNDNPWVWVVEFKPITSE